MPIRTKTPAAETTANPNTATAQKKQTAVKKVMDLTHGDYAHLNLNEDLMDTADAIVFLKCSITTLYNWRREGLLPWIPLGGKVFYLRQDLEKLLLLLRRTGIPPRKKKK